MLQRFFLKQSSNFKRALLQPKPFLNPATLQKIAFKPTPTLTSTPIHPFSSTNTNLFVKQKGSAQRNFSHISKDFVQEAYNASEQLMSFDSMLMDTIVTHYVKNIFPKENRQKIPEYIIELLKEEDPETLPKTPVALAYEIFKSLKTITEFLDRAERGFLTGDMSVKLISSTNKFLGELLQKLPETSELTPLAQENRDLMISDCFNRIAKASFDGLFRLPKTGIAYPDFENPRNLFERQLLLEDESNEIAVEKFLNVYDDLQSLGLSYNLSFAKNAIVEWFPNLTKAVNDEKEQCLLGNLKGDRKYYAPYLVKLSSEKIALIALTELMKSILKLTQRRKDDDGAHAFSIISKALFDSIGKSVNAQIIFDFEEEMEKVRNQALAMKQRQEMMQKQIKKEDGEEEEDESKKESSEDAAKKKKAMNVAARTAAISKRILKNKATPEAYQSVSMTRDIQLKMGSLLVYLMKETIKVKNEEGFYQNLMSTGYTKIKGKKQYIGVLNVNEEFLIDMIAKIGQKEAPFIQIDRCLPMVFKPAPWQDYEIGGYYQKPTNFMRIQESKLQERSIKFADLQPTFDVLDILNKTPWRINQRVLKAVEGIWEEGGGAGEIPPRHYNFKNYVYEYQLRECKSPAERIKLLKKIQQQRDIHSLRCDFTLKLNVAKAFENIEKFYFPHNIDFRGRIYPIPPHLNHIQADICRGLLEFAEGKPIGKNGLMWLKIHLSNKMGKDKLSMNDRIAYAESMIPVVERCVKDPLKHREWLECEDSWQTLAAMCDLYDALQNPNPEEHISHLHIHQDGSCNGLQHYAALGRDYEGAEQVNLMNTEKPGDIYTHVANMVQGKINVDAANPEAKHHVLAKKLVGNVKRKIVKQTVMTSVYGVTFTGARAQIQKQLKDKDFINAEEEKELFEASHYMAALTLECINDLFSGAHLIKKWLIECASLIASTGNPVSWITPLGLPVVQPYRSNRGDYCISTIIQNVTVSSVSEDLPINKNKQKSAFPPNFVHSLDSTHLMYTALECSKEGIVFAAVHDSYWTHAGTIERMNELLRDQFVRLHSQPLLENLKRSFERRFPDIVFPEIPKGGDFELENVKKSVYFFA